MALYIRGSSYTDRNELPTVNPLHHLMLIVFVMLGKKIIYLISLKSHISLIRGSLYTLWRTNRELAYQMTEISAHQTIRTDCLHSQP